MWRSNGHATAKPMKNRDVLRGKVGKNYPQGTGRAGRALIETRGDAGHKHTQRTAKKRASVAVLRAFRVSSNQRFNNFEAFSREGHQLSLGLRLWINKND